MTTEELLARVLEQIRMFDALRVRGTGWSGNARDGFAFDSDAAGGGGGSLFGGGIPPSTAPPGPPGGPPGGGFPPYRPPPIPPSNFGACCVAGACTVSTAAQCATMGGTFHLGADCFLGDPCGLVGHSGACCYTDGTCSVVPAINCTGIYLGDNSSCVGADCAGRIACANSGGTYCACGVSPVGYIPAPVCCPNPATGCLSGHWETCGDCTDFVGGYCCCCCCQTAFGPGCTNCGF